MCQLRIHLAAAILANDPPPGFAASLLNETNVPLQIWVLDQGFQRPISTQGGDFSSLPNSRGSGRNLLPTMLTRYGQKTFGMMALP